MPDTNFIAGVVRDIRTALAEGDQARAKYLTEKVLAVEVGTKVAFRTLAALISERRAVLS
ncbi:hypothetical protein [uncultured Variovorax sp.]|uniref:hypothetical protein n=1 Tax=uncultured Variovorax sp. TaxID=114708 RepID=UPI0026061ADD|nr:hypothetical protein [uncultured Variovorax sp.]